MAQRKVVVDASVIVKWFLDEPYSGAARQLRDEYVKRRISIAVPALLFYEALNALHESGRYSSSELQEAATTLSLYGFDVKGPTQRLLQSSARISMEKGVSVYDAAYLVLTEVDHLPFYTADEELARKFPQRAKHIRALPRK